MVTVGKSSTHTGSLRIKMLHQCCIKNVSKGACMCILCATEVQGANYSRSCEVTCDWYTVTSRSSMNKPKYMLHFLVYVADWWTIGLHL